MIDAPSDTHLTNPADDLLGVGPSARILASRLAAIQPPLTVGIYGEWGSGKTSFVWFLASYLAELIPCGTDGSGGALFIPFSAWQYKTADEVWQALILTITRKLLGVPDVPDKEAAPLPEHRGLTARIKRFLAEDALVIRQDPKAPDAASNSALNMLISFQNSIAVCMEESARVWVREPDSTSLKPVSPSPKALWRRWLVFHQ
jgi:hypothetical protein